MNYKDTYNSMTVGEMKDLISNYSDDTVIVLTTWNTDIIEEISVYEAENTNRLILKGIV